jgi:hypothetical protein
MHCWTPAHRTWFCLPRGKNGWGLESTRTIELEPATQESVTGEVCGPVRIQIEGFPPIYNEVSFVEMKPQDGEYEPLIGYLVLEQSQAGVDMLGHRLIRIKHMDLK